MTRDAAGHSGIRMTPGRIAALAIGVPVALAIIGFTSFSWVAQLGQASFPVSYSIPVSDHHLTAQVDGNITLRQAQVSNAELKGTARYSLFRPTVTQNGSTVSFNCRFRLGNCSLNATLEVPEQTAMSLSTSGGDVSVAGFTGNLKLNTSGGHLTAGDLTGQLLQISTGGGDVDASVLNSPGQVQVNSDGGHVTVSAMAAMATVRSGGGDVNLTFTQVPSNLQIISDGGHVTVVLPHGNAKYDISPSPDGGNLSISNSVPRGPGAKNIISVQSYGGDINITEAS
jgi:DUF4097 and DUF4098 domain-containing protein YvlB